MANNGNSKTLTIISINGPYRDEATYTLIRLAHAAKEKGINVNFFNYLDGTLIGHRDQGPKEFPVIEQLFGTVLKKGQKTSYGDAAVWLKDVPSIEASITKAKDSVKFYALEADLKKRGVADTEIIEGISKLNIDDTTSNWM